MTIGGYVTGSSAAYSASIPIPLTLTPVSALDVIHPVRALADRTAFLSASYFTFSSSQGAISSSFASRITTNTNNIALASGALNAHEMYAYYNINGAGIGAGSIMTLTEKTQSGSFTLATNQVTVPAAGVYLVGINIFAGVNDATNPTQLTMQVSGANNYDFTVVGNRHSATTGHVIGASGMGIMVITSPSTEKISVVNNSAAAATVGSSNQSRLTIKRIK